MLLQRLRLVAGLGNPGGDYRKTRHNAGFMVVDKVAETLSIRFDKTKFDVIFGRGTSGDVDVVLAKPQAYMNRSGLPLRQLAHYFKILSEDMLIIHDDIDLAMGRIKIKEKGGHGGHNGLKSLIGAFGNGNFVRLRIGVGRPEHLNVTDHVLGKFSSQEKALLDQTVTRARDAVVSFFNEGLTACMNQFNTK